MISFLKNKNTFLVVMVLFSILTFQVNIPCWCCTDQQPERSKQLLAKDNEQQVDSTTQAQKNIQKDILDAQEEILAAQREVQDEQMQLGDTQKSIQEVQLGINQAQNEIRASYMCTQAILQENLRVQNNIAKSHQDLLLVQKDIKVVQQELQSVQRDGYTTSGLDYSIFTQLPHRALSS